MISSTSHVRSRDYSAKDYEDCISVFDTNVPRFFRVGERAGYTDFLRALPGPYFVLVDAAGQVLGCGGYAIREDSGVADLCWGMVRQEHHGRGLGRALVDLRIERIRQDRRVAAIALNTSQHTVGFYERIGFRLTGVEADGIEPGLDRCEMLLPLRR